MLEERFEMEEERMVDRVVSVGVKASMKPGRPTLVVSDVDTML